MRDGTVGEAIVLINKLRTRDEQRFDRAFYVSLRQTWRRKADAGAGAGEATPRTGSLNLPHISAPASS